MNKIFSLYKKLGFSHATRFIFWKILGIDKQQEQLNTLFYFLNKYADIHSLPPTDDLELRLLQQCDAKLLKVFDSVCKKYEITYWLDFGTLLGAYRHKGFIPWDDDMDICCPREDYNRLLGEPSVVLKQMGIDIYQDKGRIGIGYKHKETGIWIDVFAVDYYFTPSNNSNDEVLKKLSRYKIKFKNKKTVSKDIASIRRNKIIGNTTGDGHFLLYHDLDFDFPYGIILFDGSDVFPLSVLDFEGIPFPVPNKSENYLTNIYGKNFCNFPRTGVEHHGSEQGLLKTWAKKSNTDMNKIYNELDNILQKYEN